MAVTYVRLKSRKDVAAPMSLHGYSVPQPDSDVK